MNLAISNGSRKRLRESADSECPDQTAHLRSLIRAFTVRKQNHWILHNLFIDLLRILSMFEGMFSLNAVPMNTDTSKTMTLECLLYIYVVLRRIFQKDDSSFS